MNTFAWRHAILLAALLASNVAAQVHRCVDRGGRVTYQQRPCDGAQIAPVTPIDNPPAATPEGAAAPGGPVPATANARSAEPRNAATTAATAAAASAAITAANDAMEARDIAYQFGMRDWCEQNVPGFRQKYGLIYHEWRARNAAFVRRIESSAEHVRVRAEGKKNMAERFLDSGREAGTYCGGLSSLLVAK